MTIEEIIEANKKGGYHFFSDENMRAFKSHISDVVHEGPGGIFIVTSEPNAHDVRHYYVRRFNPDTGNVTTVMSANTSMRAAHRLAERWAERGAYE